MRTYLHIDFTRVSDLTPLKGMPLTKLACGSTPVADLSPLAGMPLEVLTCSDDIAFKNSPVLKEMKTLKTINGQPVAAYWNTVDAKRKN